MLLGDTLGWYSNIIDFENFYASLFRDYPIA